MNQKNEQLFGSFSEKYLTFIELLMVYFKENLSGVDGERPLLDQLILMQNAFSEYVGASSRIDPGFDA